MCHLLLLFFLVCASGFAYAHQDRILSVGADGTIPEIPKKYGDVAFEADFSPETPLIRFTANGRTAVVPSCVARLVPSRANDEVALTGSWYHDRALLPNYVNVAFFVSSAPREPGQQADMEILFSIETSEVIQVTLRGNRKTSPSSGRYTAAELCGVTD